ncbi:hypothetical protein ABE430_08900 [Brevibacillus agri]|uniref:hypothetical protein n=1 Tax=Brevibacillus agri TaxID=51101 RepID=UPI003D206E58
MTPIIMLDRLVEHLQAITENFELQSNVTGITKAPQVIAGYLPEKKPVQKQNVPDFPYVIVRYLQEEDDNDGVIASVKIIVGTYSQDAQDGWRDPLNILTRIKQDLLARPVFGESFRVEKPIKTELPEEQPFPEWWGAITLQVIMPQMEEEGGFLS